MNTTTTIDMVDVEDVELELFTSKYVNWGALELRFKNGETSQSVWMRVADIEDLIGKLHALTGITQREGNLNNEPVQLTAMLGKPTKENTQ